MHCASRFALAFREWRTQAPILDTPPAQTVSGCSRSVFGRTARFRRAKHGPEDRRHARRGTHRRGGSPRRHRWHRVPGEGLLVDAPRPVPGPRADLPRRPAEGRGLAGGALLERRRDERRARGAARTPRRRVRRVPSREDPAHRRRHGPAPLRPRRRPRPRAERHRRRRRQRRRSRRLQPGAGRRPRRQRVRRAEPRRAGAGPRGRTRLPHEHLLRGRVAQGTRPRGGSARASVPARRRAGRGPVGSRARDRGGPRSRRAGTCSPAGSLRTARPTSASSRA
jgi:hypothetical protein